MVVKVKKNLKGLDKLKVLMNLKFFYEEKEMSDIMIEFHLRKTNHLI